RWRSGEGQTVSGTWWGLFWVVLVGGGWAGRQIQSALKTRHERKLELGAAEDQRRRELAAAGRGPEPICGCTHHLAKHDKQGKCPEMVDAPVEWDADQKPVRSASRQCTCQQYVGPEPLTTLYAQDLTDLN